MRRSVRSLFSAALITPLAAVFVGIPPAVADTSYSAPLQTAIGNCLSRRRFGLGTTAICSTTGSTPTVMPATPARRC